MKDLTGAEIAVIGMDGRFPDAENINDFWSNLEAGLESVKILKEEDVLAEGENPANLSNPAYVKANAFMKDKEYFDAGFFGFRPDEAALMDPQIRVFLELCWGALEDAGHNLEQPGKIGLFAGGNPNVNWETYAILKNQEGLVDTYGLEHLINVNYMCSRVSNLLNLQGPTLHLDTACSTSLVAVQRACMSLLLRECNIALAGGITISNFTHRGYLYQEGMINSKDGHCRTFDEEATGTIRGEGGGVVVLKRLADALKDGDNIRAIIRGSGVNNDGSSKISFTAPSVDGQHKAILKAISMAGIKPETIDYVEAHGTGTNLGDPIEIEALNLAFGEQKPKSCAIGSVKSNIGHLSAAAGVAGLIKTILALQNKKIPASLHFQKPNPKINFDNGPFYVNTELQPWKNGKHPRRAGISSFGIGGTNAHLVLEEGPVKASGDTSRDIQLITFSAKSEEALNRNISNLHDRLVDQKDLKLPDVAYTMNMGRTPLAHRKHVFGRDKKEILEKLSGLAETPSVTASEIPPEVIFMFSGQGAQYLNMSHGLYETESVFKSHLDECATLYKEISGYDLGEILFSAEPTDARINETKYTQPALFAVEYAMAKLLMSWGVKPDYMIGHSIGEYVAACVSGLWSLKDTMSVVVKRAELMQHAPKGSMLSISITKENLQNLLKGREDLSLSAVNSSELCVVSGSTSCISEFQEELENQGCKSRILKTSHAFHSHLMDEILEEFAGIFDSIQFHTPKIPIVSNVTGTYLDKKEASSAAYWVSHLRQAVQFAKGLQTLLNGKERLFIELGPGNTLGTFTRAHKKRERLHHVVNMIKGPKETADDRAYLQDALGKIWQHGAKFGWNAYYQGESRQKVALPTYSFDKVEFPVIVDAHSMIREMSSVKGDRKDSKIENWFYAPSWRMKRKLLSKDITTADRRISLCLGDHSEIKKVIRDHTDESHEMIFVSAGTSYQRISANEYALNFSEQKSFDSLIQDLRDNNLLPDRIIHACGIASKADINDAEDRGRAFFSLVFLLQAYQKAGLKDVHLVVVTSGVQAILESAPSPNSGSLVPGLLKVCAQELPTVCTSHIDVDPGDFGRKDFGLLLYSEIVDESPGKIVALRGKRRFIESFQSIKLSELPSEGFRNGGTYLITGGLGPLGYHLSKHLLKEYDAKLILIGRTPMTSIENETLPKNEESALNPQDKPGRFKHLSGMGTVVYKACDVSDFKALKHSIEEAETLVGPISGVIHAAGINEGHSIDRSLAALTVGDFEEQFAPKMLGVLNLDRFFKNKTIDFCLLTSSLSSILGGLGFSAYAPANTFLDFFARFQADKNPGRWISANLDGLYFEGRSADAIDEYEIIPVFEYLTSLKEQPQVIVSIKELEDRLSKWVYKETTNNTDSEDSKDSSQTRPDPSAETEDSITEEVVDLWRKFFGKADITAADDFFEIGGDSLKVLTMITRLHKIFDVEIPIKDFFESPVAGKIADYIYRQRQTKQSGSAFMAIPKATTQERYELSSAQKRLYFLFEFDRNSIAYNIPFFATLKGELNKEKFQNTFQKLIERHESLRTNFTVIDGIVYQEIQDQVEFSIEYPEKSASISETVKEFVRPFDLIHAPLLRVGIAESKANEFLLMIDIHHIISDDVSLNILLTDFMAIYGEQSLPGLELTYKDYAVWQQNKSKNVPTRDFWLKQYSTVPEPLELPLDFSRPSRVSHEGASLYFDLDQEQANGLRKLGETHGNTLFMTILTVYYVMLNKLSAQEDIIVGTPIAGRDHADLGSIMGMFVNTLALRNHPRPALTFLDFLKEVKNNALACFENQSYQFEDLIDDLNLDRNVSRNALFDAMFVFHNTDKVDIEISDLEIIPQERIHAVSKFDLKLEASAHGEGINLNFDYCTKLFRPSTIERFADYFKSIVNDIIKDADTRITDLSVIPEAVYTKLVHGFNDTSFELRVINSVIEKFVAQVQLTPKNIAVADELTTLTYTELDEQSDRLAGNLTKFAKESTFAAIYLQATSDVAIAILGILKAGMGFLPLDPNQPVSRVEGVLEDSNCQVMVMDSSTMEKLDFQGSKIDVSTSEPTENGDEKLWAQVKITDLAYMIYTSGSTGKPKGVAVSHKNLWNYFNWFVETTGITDKDRLLVNSSFAVDAVYTQVFGALLTGAALHILPRKTYLEPPKLTGYIKENEISFIKMTPTLFNLVLNNGSFDDIAFRKVRMAMLGGESIRPTDIQQAMAMYPDIQFINHYGPTETTIGSVAQFISMEEMDVFIANPTIGSPIFNTRCYLLNEQLQLVPPGSAGELCIAGDGVAIGYVHEDEGSFIEDPFVKGDRMYRTGDLCRYTEDGKIEFLGRNDFQIKVRGYRIDPSEIELQLNKYPGISNCLVVNWERADNNHLVAYFQGAYGIAGADLKAFLSLNLPDYMVPAFYTQLDDMPLTTSGKVDRNQLPEPEIKSSEEYHSPETEVAQQLVEIWSKILALDKEQISTRANFFELGGNSMKVIQLVSRIQSVMDLTVSVVDLYEYSTIEKLTDFLTENEQESVDESSVEESETDENEYDQLTDAIAKFGE